MDWVGSLDLSWVVLYYIRKEWGSKQMVMAKDDLVLCPDCGGRMHKSGKIWSGRKKVQRYLCPGCGRKAIMRPPEEKR